MRRGKALAFGPRTYGAGRAASGVSATLIVGYPRSRQAWKPPARGRTRSIPRRLRISATRALEASLGQVQ